MAEDGENHIIDIWKVDEEKVDEEKVDDEMVASMKKKISTDPNLLSKAAGKKSCCIFRVPTSLVEVNRNVKAYQPRIVSIGPYHHHLAHSRFNMIQEHKWRYLGSLLSRTHAIGLSLQDYLKAIALLESQARECYSETISLNSRDFIEMMVLDGCFILELFRKVGRLVPFEPDDPLVTMSWILPSLCGDFLKLENQIPYFILQRLYQISNSLHDEPSPTLSSLALEFFKDMMQRPGEVITQFPNLKGKHLLDLVRSSHITKLKREQKRITTPTHVIHCVSKLRRAGIKITRKESGTFLDITTPTQVIHCISKLRRAGIKITRKESGTFLDVTFRDGIIQMPTITIDDFMSLFLLNCEAFEQCYNGCSQDITSYVTLMDCLINTHRDVGYLCDQNIIKNHFGTDGQVASFFNNARIEVAFDINASYLSQLFDDVHQYYQNAWHVHWASFKYTYFDTPWSFISALAALVLLVLTVAQTYLSAVQAYH